MKNYPLIGSKVNFIRFDGKDQEFMEGKGIVQAIFLSPEKRIMIQVKIDGGDAYNIDFYAINASDAEKDNYQEMIERVNSITDEGNAIVKETVESYNNQVEDIYNFVLGAPVKSEEL